MFMNNAEVDGWTLVGVSAGVSKDQWRAELYGDNLLDEMAELSNSFGYDRERVSYVRPRTIGLRLALDF